MIQERADRLSHCDIEDEQQVLLPNMVSDEVGAEQSVAHSRLASFVLPSVLLKAMAIGRRARATRSGRMRWRGAFP